ncbi:MAG: hypothetical protein IPJ69_03155 [Deltaproteobacteria bacterium]|nr:MAG: hypothetical protein IPJ69_03155 [Deltaproteobacteria bacterium]
MPILFANPPWEIPGRKTVRSGSRWPHSYPILSTKKKSYKPYPFFLAFAASYLAQYRDDVDFHDSILHDETEEDFFKIINSEKYEFIILEVSTPSHFR